MVKKNLNKKVGCALIAAGLLAVSSVQGSGAPEDTATEEDPNFRRPIGMIILHGTGEGSTSQVLATIRPSSSGVPIKFIHTEDYSLFGDIQDMNGERRMYHILLPHGQQYSGEEFAAFAAWALPGFEWHDLRDIGCILVPVGIAVRDLSNGGVSLFSSDEPLGASISDIIARGLAEAANGGGSGSDESGGEESGSDSE
jgi:hypothetical protein